MKTKTLIINLRKLGDVFCSAHLIHSLAEQNSESSVSLLIYKESLPAARLLKNVDRIYTIDRKEIIMLKQNKIFSNGSALEYFFEQISELELTNWNQVLNYSNDAVSTLITSFLTINRDTTYLGLRLDNKRKNQYSNEWAFILNDVVTQSPLSPLHFVDVHHQITGTPFKNSINKTILTEESSLNAINEIDKILEQFNYIGEDAKIIGIQLKSGDDTKDFSEKTISNLIIKLIETQKYIPILFTSHLDGEKTCAAQIATSVFDQIDTHIPTIECSLTEINAHLLNLQLLITPDTSIMHLADLNGIPTLTLSLGNSPFLKQGSITAGSLILTNSLRHRYQKETNIKNKITESDIFSTVEYYFGKQKNLPTLTEDVSLLRVDNDNFGPIYTTIAGENLSSFEAKRIILRHVLLSLYNSTNSKPILNPKYFDSLSGAKLTKIVTYEKSYLTEMMRDILSALRTLRASKEKKENLKIFLGTLSKILDKSQDQSLSQVSIKIFRERLESIPSKNLAENMQKTEEILFKFKDDIQFILTFIKDLEEIVLSKKRVEIMARSLQQ